MITCSQRVIEKTIIVVNLITLGILRIIEFVNYVISKLTTCFQTVIELTTWLCFFSYYLAWSFGVKWQKERLLSLQDHWVLIKLERVVSNQLTKQTYVNHWLIIRISTWVNLGTLGFQSWGCLSCLLPYFLLTFSVFTFKACSQSIIYSRIKHVLISWLIRKTWHTLV